ncbi:hypothetical protein [Lacinutrix jangbogonensis]|nr:hypothetical protein [Lacinutrix jangbogonensis]
MKRLEFKGIKAIVSTVLLSQKKSENRFVKVDTNKNYVESINI